MDDLLCPHMDVTEDGAVRVWVRQADGTLALWTWGDESVTFEEDVALPSSAA